MNIGYNSIPRNGLVGERLLDGSAIDTNDGTKNNGTATNVTWANTDRGYQKQAGSFNASATTNVKVPCSNLGNGEYSFSFIFKTPSNINNGDFNYILDFSTPNVTQHRLSIRIMPTIYGGLLRVYIRGNGSESYRDSLSVLNDNNYHIGYVYIKQTTSTINIYIDGALNQSVQYGGVMGTVSTNNSFRLGSYHDGATVGGFNGNIQGVRIYNRALSSDEVQNLYLEGQRQLGLGSDGILNGCIAYYDFNGDANDVIGGNNGTVSGATLTTDRFGIANRAYTFSGSGQGISTTKQLITGAGNYTIGFWFKTTSTTALTSANYQYDGYLFYKSGNKLSFRVRQSSPANWILCDSTSDVNTGNRVFGVGVISGTSMKIYINGSLESTQTVLNLTTNTNTIQIGSSNGLFTPSQWEGDLGLHMYFNRALSDDEVKELYNLSSKKYLYPFKKTLPLNLKNGLVFWGSGDTSGTTYYDASGSGNNGTMANSPTINRIFQNKSIALNGSNQYVSLGTGNIGIGGDITVSMWANPTNITGYQELFNDWGATTKNCYIYSTSNGNGLISALTGNGASLDDGTAITYQAQTGKYQHITYVRSGNSKRLYINGCLVGSYSGGYTGGVTSNAKTIGGEAGGNFFNGKLSNPMIWNRALTQTEIQQLYYSQFIS